MLRLGDVVAREGRLTEEAIEAAIETVRRFKTIADVQHSDEIVAMATAAMRQAANGPEAAERIEAATGVRIQVVSGIREAQLDLRRRAGERAHRPGPGPLRRSRWGEPRALGRRPVRPQLCARAFTSASDGSRPSSCAPTRRRKKDRARLKEQISKSLDEVLEDILACGPKLLIGTSGTFCALGRGAAARRDGIVPYSVNQLTVTARELAALGEIIYELPSWERGRLPGIDARRAELLPAGVAVAEVLMERTGMRELTVSEWGLREGIIISTIARHDRVELEQRPAGDPACLGPVAVPALEVARGPFAPGRPARRRAVRLDVRPARARRRGPGAARAGRAPARHRRAREPRRPRPPQRLPHRERRPAGLLARRDPDAVLPRALPRAGDVRGSPSRPGSPSSARTATGCMKMLSLLRIADGLDAAHDSVIGHVGVELSRHGGGGRRERPRRRRARALDAPAQEACSSRSCSRSRSALRWCRRGRRRCRPWAPRRLVWPDGRAPRPSAGSTGHAPCVMPPRASRRSLRPAPRLHPQRQVGAGADRDRAARS